MSTDMTTTDDMMAEMGFAEDRPDYLPTTSDRGSEGVGMEDLTIPRLDIIQSISPQADEEDPEYIPGAKAGTIFNNVTNQLYGPAVFFVPCFYRKEFNIWKDRNKGGGFAGSFPTEADAKRALAELESPDDYDILDTGVHFGLLVLPGGTPDAPVVEEVTVSMAKSKAKVSRKLNTLVRMAGGDRFSKVYKLSTVREENNNGDKYHNFKVDAMGYVSKALYKRAEALYEAVASGQKDINREEKEVPAEEDLDQAEY